MLFGPQSRSSEALSPPLPPEGRSVLDATVLTDVWLRLVEG